MKKLNSKQIFTYVALIGVLVLVVVYFLVYQKNMEKAEVLSSSNNTLESRVNSLKKYVDEEPQYIAEMEVMKPMIAEILEAYPAGILEEDVIMQAVVTQMSAPLVYNLISINEDENNKTIEEATVKGAGIEEYQREISFVQTTANYDNSLTYDELKNVIQTLFDSKYKIGIQGITYAKESATGEDEEQIRLNGSLELVFYSVKGNNQVYEKPDILPYTSGTNNFFSELSYVNK